MEHAASKRRTRIGMRLRVSKDMFISGAHGVPPQELSKFHDCFELPLRRLYRPAVNTRSMGISRGALGRGEMTKFGDLAVHAQRCDELAGMCTDRTVALKLRALATEYRDMAKHSTIVTLGLAMKRCPLCGTSQSTEADEAL